METSVDAVTFVEAVDELFAGFRSNTVVEAVAVLEIDPVNAGLMVYVLVITALPPEAIVPKLHGKAVAQLPEFETKVRLAGVVSATETPVASPVPTFDTVVV
jgi:hypothetical protein